MLAWPQVLNSKMSYRLSYSKTWEQNEEIKVKWKKIFALKEQLIFNLLIKIILNVVFLAIYLSELLMGLITESEQEFIHSLSFARLHSKKMPSEVNGQKLISNCARARWTAISLISWWFDIWVGNPFMQLRSVALALRSQLEWKSEI